MPAKSQEEQDALATKFREECLAEGVIAPESEAANDMALLKRFLRARQYDFKASKLMLKNCEQWRANVGGKGMDDLYRELDPFDYPEREVVFEHWPLYFHKTDKRGRPINIHHFGSINPSELNKAVSPERFQDILTVNCDALTREILPASAVAAGKQVETVLVIVDLKGFGIGQFWAMKDLVRKSFQISQDYYPETMGAVAIINAPMTFTTMWSAIKAMVAKETAEKVQILGSDYKTALLELCDADALPPQFGGTCSDCTGPGGCAKSSAGPWLDHRQERRAAWLARERPVIALTKKDIEPDAPATDDAAQPEMPAAAEPPPAGAEGPLPANAATVPAPAAGVPGETPAEAAVAAVAVAGETASQPALASSVDADTPVASAAAPTADVSAPAPAPEPPLTASPEPSINRVALPILDLGVTASEPPRPDSVAPTAPTAAGTDAPSAAPGAEPVLAFPSSSSSSATTAAGPATPASTATSLGVRDSARKPKKSIGSVFSSKSREPSVGGEQDDGSPRRSKFRSTVDKLVNKMSL